MHSTLVGGSQSPRGSDMGQSSQGALAKGSPRRAMSKLNLEQRKQIEAEEKAAIEAAEAKGKSNQDDDTIDVDEQTGQQVFINELASQLTIQQKLQLRIAQETGIDIDNLRGDEFQVLKDFKKLEKRRVMLNELGGFIDEPHTPNMFKDASLNSITQEIH